MVSHELNFQGVGINGVAQRAPALLQMHDEDFPVRFLADLSALPTSSSSTVTTLLSSPSSAVTLYQPVQRIVHVAMMQLSCNSVGSPRLDPSRVDSAGVVMRRVVRRNGVDDLTTSSAWMKSSDGQLQWVALSKLRECEDPDPAKRPQLQSGQPELDRLLALQSITGARTEIFSPAFVAPPAVCEAAGRTVVYAVLPTASSEVSTDPRPAAQYDPAILSSSLPTLLQAGPHNAPLPNGVVTYQYMSDDFARANNGTGFLPFSLSLRMLYAVFGAFDNSPASNALLAALNKHNVFIRTTQSNGSQTLTATPMGSFYQQAASALIDYNPVPGQAPPPITMPAAWDGFSNQDAAEILSAISAILNARSANTFPSMGRFQDSSRLYRVRLFVRVKGESTGCPLQLLWSPPSDPFRIAAWHESGGRAPIPVPLPDPTSHNFLKNARPNCSFAVPAALMNAMQGTKLADLSSGAATPPGPGIQLDWICSFNIPIITICAFFVLNIFLVLLNMIFFWLPFIKICLPIPLPTTSNSGDTNGT